MIFLGLAVLCSLVIGMILKHAARHTLDRGILLTINYAVAFLLGLALFAPEVARQPAWSPPLLLLGVVTGILFIVNFWLFAHATARAGMALAMTVMRVAVVMPFLASWWIWDEVPTLTQGLGLILAGGAFFLITGAVGSQRGHGNGEPGDPDQRPARAAFPALALLFLGSGSTDILLKTYEERYAEMYTFEGFLVVVFGVATLTGLGVLVRQRHRLPVARPIRASVGWGIALGVVNYGSALFFLRAIEALTGPFVFPVNHIAVVLGGALLGVLFWGERLSPINKVGLVMAAVALLLMNLP